MNIISALEGYQPPDPSSYRPLEVEYKLATPLILSFPWIYSDGLMARQLMLNILGDEFYNLPAKKPIPVWKHLRLPLKMTGEIYHASASVLDTDEKHTTTFYKRFHEAGDLKTKAKIRLGSGQFRAYMMKMPYSASRSVRFYMHGDPDEVRRLMGSVRNLGKKHSAGGGEVAGFEVREIAEDWSLIRDGVIMRNIPAKMLREFTLGQIMNAAYRFPYWDKNNIALCVVPGSQGSIA